MSEYISRTYGKENEYEIIFKTSDREEYKKIEEACRAILDRKTATKPELLTIRTLEKEVGELRAKVSELEEKHWDDCRQIAQYDDDLKRLFNEMLECLNGTIKAANYFSRILRANANPYKQPDKSPAPKVKHINCKCGAILIGAETITKKMVDKAIKEATMNIGDYFNSDGLLVCGKSRLPKECKIELFGKMQTVPCLCGCVATDVKTSEVSKDD